MENQIFEIVEVQGPADRNDEDATGCSCCSRCAVTNLE
jgi:hypothetical protein